MNALQGTEDKVNLLVTDLATMKSAVSDLGTSTTSEIADVKTAIAKLQQQVADGQQIDPQEIEALNAQLDAIHAGVTEQVAAITGSQQALAAEDAEVKAI